MHKACFAQSCTAKRLLLNHGNQYRCTSLRDLIKDALLKDRKEQVQHSRPLEFLLSKWALYHCATTTAHLFNGKLTSKVRRVEQGSRNPESNFLRHQWRTHFLTWLFSFLFLFCVTFLSSVQNSFYLFFH